jgi:hypothetical protein
VQFQREVPGLQKDSRACEVSGLAYPKLHVLADNFLRLNVFKVEVPFYLTAALKE